MAEYAAGVTITSRHHARVQYARSHSPPEASIAFSGTDMALAEI